MNTTLLNSPYSIDELEAMMIEIETIDLKTSEFGKICEAVNKIFAGIVCQIIFCPITPIFRGRINSKNSSYKSINELIFPKQELLKNYSRLSKPHNQVLYASSKINTAIFEIQPEIEDIVTVIQFELDEKHETLQTYEIGVREDFFKDVPHVLSRGNSDYSEEYKNKVLRIESFFIEQFSKQIKKGDEHLYKITAAIGEFLFFNNDFAECLIYPSVACYKEGLNVGIKPSVFMDKFRPIGVAEFKILDKMITEKTKAYDIVCLKKSSEILDNGAIIW